MKYHYTKKHPVAFLLAAMMICQPITAQAVTFADMNNVPWPGAEVSINKAAELGLVVGETINGKSYFKPKDPVSLTQSCQLAYKLLLETGKAKADAEVQKKWSVVMDTYKIQSWAHPAVSFCLENGIVEISELSGFVKGEVNVSATREQAATILGRALEVGVPSLDATATATVFKDNASISATAKPYVALLNSKKIVNGDDVGKFNPKSTLNRTETAVMVTNMYSILNSAVSEPVVAQPTSQTGKIAALTNFYVNFENSDAYYLYASSSVSATLNGGSTSVADLATLFKNNAGNVNMNATVTLDSSQRVTKIVVTSDDIEEEKATEGILTSVYYNDEDNRGSVTIANKHNHKIPDADDIYIEIDKKEYDLEQLDDLFESCKKNNENIKISLTLDKNEEVTKIIGTIETDGDNVKGTLTDIDYDDETGEGELELDDKEDYTFDDDTNIKIDNKSSDAEDLVDIFDEYYDNEEDLRITLTVDGKYAESIEVTTKGESSTSNKGEITNLDIRDDEKGVIQLKNSKKYVIPDVDSLTIEVIDGDDEIDEWDDLYIAQVDDNKTIEVTLGFEDGDLVEIKGEVVWVKGLLVDFDTEYLSIKGKDSGKSFDYNIDEDKMEKVSVKGLKSSISNLDDLIDYLKDETAKAKEDGDSYYVEDEKWTLKLTLKDGYITSIEEA